MRIAFISGPYRADTQSGIDKNIAKAAQYAKKYWRKGYSVICPHMNSAHFDNIVPDKSFLDGDLEFIKRMIPGYDVIVMIPDWEYSTGAQSERRLAQERDIEIIYERKTLLRD